MGCTVAYASFRSPPIDMPVTSSLASRAATGTGPWTAVPGSSVVRS
ncbi:hypothetical protein SFUMM280S_00998 [Streptomyces fumanus]